MAVTEYVSCTEFVLQKELKFLSFWYMNAVMWGIHVVFFIVTSPHYCC